MKKNITIILLILSIITTVATVLAFIFFFKVIKNKNQHTSALATTLADKMSQKKNAEIINKKMIEIDKTKSIIDNYFIDSKSVDSFIDYLENLGVKTNTGVKVNKFDTSAKGTLLVDISAEGTFSNIMRTLMLLENAPYKIHITKTYLSRQLNQTPQLVEDTKDPTKKTTITVPGWHIDISFSVLVSS